MPEIFDAAVNPAAETVSQKPLHKRKKPTEYSEVMRTCPINSRPLSAFLVQPSTVFMSILEEDEKILMLVRKHFITNLRWIILVVIMLFAPLITNLTPLTFLPARFITATGVLWYLLTLGIALNGFLSWFYNANVITDERVIDIDFLNLVYKNVSSAKIDNIEDVTVQMGGAIRNVLDFGTVLIQTAAEKTEFEFDDAPHPQKVAKLLNELMLEEEQEKLDGRAK
jgi:hypothetical protein